MSYDAGEEPRCGRCAKPKALSTKNGDAVDAFWRLASRRVWDGMSGNPRPLPLSEIRMEAGLSEDPDAQTARILLLDSHACYLAAEEAGAAVQNRHLRRIYIDDAVVHTQRVQRT